MDLNKLTSDAKNILSSVSDRLSASIWDADAGQPFFTTVDHRFAARIDGILSEIKDRGGANKVQITELIECLAYLAASQEPVEDAQPSTALARKVNIPGVPEQLQEAAQLDQVATELESTTSVMQMQQQLREKLESVNQQAAGVVGSELGKFPRISG